MGENNTYISEYTLKKTLPIIYKDKIYFPVRILAEAFGRFVSSDEQSNTIIIKRNIEAIHVIEENIDKFFNLTINQAIQPYGIPFKTANLLFGEGIMPINTDMIFAPAKQNIDELICADSMVGMIGLKGNTKSTIMGLRPNMTIEQVEKALGYSIGDKISSGLREALIYEVKGYLVDLIFDDGHTKLEQIIIYTPQ